MWRVSSQAIRSTSFENLKGAMGDVCEIADGSGDEIQSAGHSRDILDSFRQDDRIAGLTR